MTLPPGIFTAARDAFAPLATSVHARQATTGETHVWVICDDPTTPPFDIVGVIVERAPVRITNHVIDHGFRGPLRLRLHFRMRSQLEPGELDGTVAG